MASDHVFEADASSFDESVLSSDVPVVVDFWAPWCGPCKAIGPMLDQVAESKGGELRIAKVNVDQNMPLAAKYGVRNIPALLLVKGGKVVDTRVGALSRSAFEGWIAQAY
jgi:thioredoxin 1